jgi:hypothetical protein
MSTWIIENPLAGSQLISETSTTQRHDLGEIVRAVHGTYGMGEFIYLPGVASTVVGSWVWYDLATPATTLLDAGDRGQVAVAMSANVADQWGWYQISGLAVGLVLADFADGGLVFATATDGSVDDAAVTGDQIDGAIGRSAIGTPAAGQALIQLSRPCMNAAPPA